jgi:hypothetical protein
MLYNWLAKANVIIPRIVTFRRNATKISLVAPQNRPSGAWFTEMWPCRSFAPSYRSFKSTPRLLAVPALPQPHSDPHPSGIPPHSTPAPFAVKHLSSSQISRASATAIRISLARGATWDAFHLWHSLRWSALHYYEPLPNSLPRPPFRKPTTAFVPIDFGRAVSTRFAGHCLLHGLLRVGETKTAARLAQKMMTNGEELRPLSFSILLRQLHPSANQNTPRAIYDRFRNRIPRKLPLEPGILDLQNVMPDDPLTRFAVRLLSNAREHRWQRTTGMYESVLRACLLQGEILVASLLLALLLKDYQLRQACFRVATEAERVEAPDAMVYVQSKLPDAPSRGFKLLPGYRSHYLYQSVIGFLKKHVHVDDPLFPEVSQALATLALALDDRRIPYTNLAPLIKLLYSYPQCQHKVWVTLPSGQRQSLNAYRYFHRVLFDLLCSLPDHRSRDVGASQFPALNLESYNALLNYAMRFRHSVSLADRVLYQIRKHRLAPSMTTYNTLLRGCTLLRRNDLAESILCVMRRRMPGSQVDVFIPHFPLATPPETKPQIGPLHTDLPFEPHRRRFCGLLKDTRESELTIPEPKGLLEPDNVLLTTYMAHLIATGRPDTVATLIVRVIPELEPSQRCLSPEGLSASSSGGVAGGVTLGPHFFAVALNALRKAGRRSFAERVWALARAAEAKSLEPGSRTPWCLSTHAYTTMLQLYVDETRGWHSHGQPHDLSRKVIGAERAERLPRPKDPRRAKLGVQKGMQIYRALPCAAEKVREVVVRERHQDRKWNLEPPAADARFYNAALGLVSRRPGMPRRSSRQGSRWRWNRLLGAAHKRFLRTGHKPHGWTPELEEIVQGVKSAGYALPLGFRLRLVGRDAQIRPQEKMDQEKMDLGMRPYSFGKKARPRFAPHRIPTVKSKGFPVAARGRWRRLEWWSMAAPGVVVRRWGCTRGVGSVV